ncbi:MAG: hypothetical protein HZA77_00295 [Candidatus Schekmanbacteria bacterium]|nr:hypothetical protein [Candidatus Schekmanbacteria bacterium]
MEVLYSGIPGLDDIFLGGVPRDNCILLEGPAGSGKTTFGLQFIVSGATKFNEKGIIVTLEERPKMLYRDAVNYGWDLKKLESEGSIHVIQTSPKALLDMLSDPESHLNSIYEKLGIKRIFIDSITQFKRISETANDYREMVNKVIYAVSARESATILTRELLLSPQENLSSVEDYVVDTVIRLSYEPSGDRKRERFMEILKSRGQDYISGKHSFIFDTSGINIFPSCYLKNYDLSDIPKGMIKRLSTGISGLDRMLGGGIQEGKTALIAGSSGTGKKTLGIQFLNEGFEEGEKGLFISLHNRPEEIINSATSYSIDLDHALREGTFEILYRSPMDLIVDELGYSIKKICREMEVKRVVLDSLNDLIDAIKDENYLKNFIFFLVDFFSTNRITALFTLELKEIFENSASGHREMFSLIPIIISFRYVELESEIRRALSVIKVGGSDHDKGIHEYRINNGGIEVMTKFEGREGVMSGSPKKVDMQLKEILANMSLYEKALRKEKITEE